MPKIFARPPIRKHYLLDPDDMTRLDECARLAGQNTSQLLRLIIKAFLRHSEDRIRREMDEMNRSLKANGTNLESRPRPGAQPYD